MARGHERRQPVFFCDGEVKKLLQQYANSQAIPEHARADFVNLHARLNY